MGCTISVIVAVYKVESYLRQCLDSIVNQTYKDLQIILIDDGSPDRCGVICDEYAEQDQRVQVIHKKNSGLSAAWNEGLRVATGKWISFVDSDDWIELDYFDNLVKDPQTEKAEVIHTSGAYYEEENRKYVRRTFLLPFFFEDGNGRENLIIHCLVRPFDKRAKMKISGVWGKLYRTSFLKKGKFLFDERIRAGLPNDILFNIAVYKHVTVAIGILYYGYHYRITQNSGTLRYDPNRVQSQSYVLSEIEKQLTNQNASKNITKAFESYCLRDIVQNLEHTFFSIQNNKSTKQEIVSGIKEMKKIRLYHNAIYSHGNPYNNVVLIIFQFVLRSPFIWPLKIMVKVWKCIDTRK